MNTELNEIAESLNTRLSNLEHQEVTIKGNLSEVQQEKSETQVAIKRINLFRSGSRHLAIDDCINCFIRHGRDSKMTAIPSDSGIDLFRCRQCGHEKEVEP